MSETTQTKEKKISFISAMLIVMGGSIGAGIFFKSGGVLSSSHSSIILAAFCWIIASCAVIAMALALIEISSVKNDNLSLMSWTKVFCSRRIYLSSKDFMTYIYLPLTYFFMPLYTILSLQDGFTALLDKDAVFGTSQDWMIWLTISLLMTVYFLTVPALWSRVGNIQNQIVLAIKFIPLIFVGIIGFVLVGTNNGGTENIKYLVENKGSIIDAIKNGESVQNFTGLGAGLGVFLAITAIFFAYDGFYVAAGIQSEMKEPKKTPAAIFLGLMFTTVIYLIIAISMSINGGSFFGMKDYMAQLMGDTPARIIFGVINICIAIGVLGIINGFSMWAPRFVEDLLALGDLPLWQKYQGKLNANKPVVGVVYSLAITIPIVILFTTIGSLAYLPINKDYAYYDSPIDWRGGSMNRLYTFADLMANWTALFTFAFIAFAILGGIMNRKTGKIVIKDKKKYFMPMAIISVIIVFAALFVQVIVPIVDVFLLAGFDADFRNHTEATNAINDFLSRNELTKDLANLPEVAKVISLNMSNEAAAAAALQNGFDVKVAFTDLVVGRVALVVVLGLFVALSFAPSMIQDRINIKKYGSIEKYEEEKARVLAAKVANATA